MVEKKSLSRIIFIIINYTLLTAFCIACIAPIWHVLMASISDPKSLMASTGIVWFPRGQITSIGYELVFKNENILIGYVNTLLYVSATTFIGTVMTLIAGYVISRERLLLKSPITFFILFTMIFSGGLMPTYMVIKGLGLIGSRLSVIIPGVINGFFIVMMKSSFEQLPDSFEESARIDGAGPVLILVKILAPLVKSTVAVIIMYTVIMQWNSWFPASIYLPRNREKWPLQLFMREILVQNDTAKILSGADVAGKTDFAKNLVKYCVTVVGTLPLLVVYPFAQKYFEKGVTLGGVKG